VRHRSISTTRRFSHSGAALPGQRRPSGAERVALRREESPAFRRILVAGQRGTENRRPSKTTAHRTVRLLAPLREDLLAWQLRSGRPRDTAPVFPGPEGRSWSKMSYDNWRGRNFDRAMERAGVEGSTPYALWHSFASLLLHEGAR
jgi:hypothetical protein